MAGWLAWNLRIITVAAVACFSYYGADYWSSRNRYENIERVNFSEPQEPEIIESLKLGTKRPEVATKYFTRIGSGSGGQVTGVDALIKSMNEKCEKSPNYHILHDPNLTNRRYCRLYWGIDESIDILIETENKQVLLSSETEEWMKKWEEYKKGDKPWGEIAEEPSGRVPSRFKTLCQEKAKESVYDIDNNKYVDVTNYCTRKKLIKDVLDKEKVKLLKEDDNSGKWEANFKEYSDTKIGERFTQDVTDISKFKKACEKTIQFETTASGYKNSLSVVKRYCR